MKLAKAVALYKLFQVTSRTVRFGYRLQAQTCLHSSQSPSALPPTSHRAFCKMDVFSDIVGSLRRMKAREYATQAMNLGLVVTSALIIWKSLMLVTGSESPVVVVLSGSMEPGFRRGDILFLHLGPRPIRTGEIVVFNIAGRDIPIVHRALKVHEDSETGEVSILTKGDNNYGDDRVLYAPGQEWLSREHIMGRAAGYLPGVGMITIVMNDYPWLKFGLIGLLGLLVLTTKE